MSIKETSVVSCDKLALDLNDHVICNTGKDQYGCTCEPNVGKLADDADDRGDQTYRGKEESVSPVQPVGCLEDILSCGLTGSDTGYETAVLLNAVAYLNGIELDKRIEERERDDQEEVCDVVVRASGEIPEPHCNGVRALGEEHGDDHRRQCQDGHCEDDGHNAALVDLKRYIRTLAAVELSAYCLLGVLNRDPSLCVLYVDNEDDDRDGSHRDYKEYKYTEEYSEYGVGNLTAYLCGSEVKVRCHGRQSRYDTGKDYKRYTVADTLLIDPLAEPYDEACTCGKGYHDEYSRQGLGDSCDHCRSCGPAEQRCLKECKSDG